MVFAVVTEPMPGERVWGRGTGVVHNRTTVSVRECEKQAQISPTEPGCQS